MLHQHSNSHPFVISDLAHIHFVIWIQINMDEEVLKGKEKQSVCQHMGLQWNSSYVKHCLKLVIFTKYCGMLGVCHATKNFTPFLIYGLFHSLHTYTHTFHNLITTAICSITDICLHISRPILDCRSWHLDSNCLRRWFPEVSFYELLHRRLFQDWLSSAEAGLFILSAAAMQWTHSVVYHLGNAALLPV